MQGKKESLLKVIMQTMVSLLQKLSRMIVTCYVKRIPLAVLERTIRMVSLKGILKQLRNGLGQTCCILLITGQPKLKSASGHRQSNMLYGFSTGCQILQMVCRQMRSGLLVVLQQKNFTVHMYLVVQYMFLMPPCRMVTKYLNGRRELVSEFFLGSLPYTHPRSPS